MSYILYVRNMHNNGGQECLSHWNLYDWLPEMDHVKIYLHKIVKNYLFLPIV